MISLLLVFFIFVASVKGARFERRWDSGRARGRQALAAGEGDRPHFLSGLSPPGRTAGAPVLHTILFAAGSAALGEAAREELTRLGPALWKAPGPFVVAGYAAAPAASRGLAVDWLSFERALAVCEFLASGGRPPGADRESPFLPASGGAHG